MIKKEKKTWINRNFTMAFIQECYEFFERMSSKYIDIIEKDSQCIDIKRFQHNSVPTFNDENYNIQISPIREVTIKFNVLCDYEKLKGK